MLLTCGLLALISAPLFAEVVPLKQFNIINAEDLASIDNGSWVIASSMAGGQQQSGALYTVNTETGTTIKVYPPGDRAGLEATADAPPIVPGCDAQVPPSAFAPHGIATQTLSPNRETLFVVNHGVRESIEVFEIVMDKVPKLVWQGCIPLPNETMGNAVAVTKDYQVYVSNMRAPADEGAKKVKWMGNILVWSKGSGWSAIAGSNIYAVNGLLVSDDGSEIYVASWAGGEVIKLTRRTSDKESATRQTLSLPFLPDNLRWGPDKTILATGLRSNPGAVGECVMATDTCKHSIPTGIASIKSDSFAMQCLRNIPFQMGTTSLPVGNKLWVGPTRGESVWVLDYGPESWDMCI